MLNEPRLVVATVTIDFAGITALTSERTAAIVIATAITVVVLQPLTSQ